MTVRFLLIWILVLGAVVAMKHSWNASGISNFDDWTHKYNDSSGQGRPPHEDLEQLVREWLPSLSYYTIASSLDHDTAVTESHHCVKDDNNKSGIVSWNGVSQRWFYDVFMKTPEARGCVQFECRMWFVREYVIPEMLKRRGIACGPMVDHLERFTEDHHHHQHTLSSNATVVVSFTGKYLLKHFVDLIQQPIFVDQYLWIDVFCVDQVAWNIRPTRRNREATASMKAFKKKFMIDLRVMIERVGHTALMLHRWDDVMNTLRVWVVYEVFCTIQSEQALSVVISESERQRLRQKLSLDHTANLTQLLQNSFQLINELSINVSECQAHKKEDKKHILALLQEKMSLKEVNDYIRSSLQEWLAKDVVAPLIERSYERLAFRFLIVLLYFYPPLILGFWPTPNRTRDMVDMVDEVDFLFVAVFGSIIGFLTFQWIPLEEEFQHEMESVGSYCNPFLLPCFILLLCRRGLMVLKLVAHYSFVLLAVMVVFYGNLEDEEITTVKVAFG